MQKTTFKILKMDCPSEEQMIRMKLEGTINIKSLIFDLQNRILEVIHYDDHKDIFVKLNSLKLDTSFISTEPIDSFSLLDKHSFEKKILWQVLSINFFFFVFEIIAGFISHSMGLVADSLDMLSDGIVYGLSLYVVSRSLQHKKTIAKISGYIQLILAILGFVEVIRRFMGSEEIPSFQTMIIVSFFALIGNAVSLYLLKKSKNNEAHMQASMIFTSNDVIANIGVIIAGLLVLITDSKFPDLIVGIIIFTLVGRGSFRILQISK